MRINQFKYLFSPTCLMLLMLLANMTHAAVAAPVQIKFAKYNAKTKTLVVKTATKSHVTGTLQLLHGEGGVLGSQNIVKTSQSFSIPLQQMGQPPCTVVVMSDKLAVSKRVIGAPANCLKKPLCKIVTPSVAIQTQVGTPVDFIGKAVLKDKKAGPLSYEWDFAGGVFDNSHPKTLEAQGIKFVRDNSTYRVRFAATDGQNRRCEATLVVNVGTPPQTGLVKVAESAAPVRGEETSGKVDDWVVLPFQEWSMQHTSDMKQQPIGYDSFNHLFNNLNAYVLRKGSVGSVDKPKLLSPNDLKLRYSAASNPLDPVGTGSINSTSQNWPLNGDGSQPAAFMDSATLLKKTDIWELHPPRPAETRDPNYRNWSAVQSIFAWAGLHNAIPGLPAPDEGYFPHATPPLEGEQDADFFAWYQEQYTKFKGLIVPCVEHGSYMPGKSNPYVDNSPQGFAEFDDELSLFRANAIPITDVDDAGRVNPYNLMRVEAVKEKGQEVAAKTDAVLSTSRDFHCRECHAKGKIAANPDAGHTAAAFLSSPKGQDPWYFDLRDPNLQLEKPNFYDAIGDSIYDQEYAAALNYASLHDYYDGYDFVGSMINGGGSMWAFHNGLAKEDTPKTCNGCHYTPLEAQFRKETFWIGAPYDNTNVYYNPDYSMSMHRFHGEMQYNDDKSDIVRNEKGAYARFDWKKLTQRQAGKDPNPKTLFPIFGPDGQQLPMEENCLKCHAGHREPLYNDRMATAGVTCYDCHGDMLAMGRAFPKDVNKIGSGKIADYRVAWYDQTDCGSCHTGKGSEAVKTSAFNATDLSASSRPVDRSNSNAVRFAVVPLYEKELEAWSYSWDPAGNNGEGADVDDYTPLQVKSPLYKFGKDQHANLACAACHGAAHAIGPNRDPKANENVTAIQLQGYSGPVTECNVCHTQDAFNTEDSIGSALHYPNGTDENPTILAGPHNMHPVNDPNWWKQREGGAANQTESKVNGGWHSVWAKKAGIYSEDQCASCHGADHKGTRLSKVPVDREFTTGKSKKYKKVFVKAGTPIGCDLCHSLEQSNIGRPTGTVPNPATGGGSTNKPPKITSFAGKGLNVNQTYRYSVTAADPDKDPLTFSLTDNPNGVSFDATTQQLTHTPTQGGSFSFTITVSDGKGGSVSQTSKVTVCAPPQSWMAQHGHCM